MEKRQFPRNEFKEDLLIEIINRNFSNYKIRRENFDDENVGKVDYTLIKRSAMISCWVLFIEEDESDEKYILLQPGIIESKALHFFFFITYLFTGGLTLLLGYIVYRNFQASFRDEVTNILKEYAVNPELAKNGKQKIIALN